MVFKPGTVTNYPVVLPEKSALVHAPVAVKLGCAIAVGLSRTCGQTRNWDLRILSPVSGKLDRGGVQRMRRIIKWVGIALAALLVVMVSLPLLINVEQFKPMLEGELSTALNREVKIGRAHV